MIDKILTSRHPEYLYNISNWEKWRLCYEGGDQFLQQYLQMYSTLEDITLFNIRKAITPIPAFAKAAVKDVKNSLFQRATDIVRTGGCQSYANAIYGLDDGVDLNGSSMNAFISSEILGELLALGKVGIYIDNAEIVGPTLAEKGQKHPYLYVYKTENILNWSYQGTTLTSVLLRTTNYNDDNEYMLPLSTSYEYWLLNLVPAGVRLQIFDHEYRPKTEKFLNLSVIPFVIPELSESLLTDIASYQIAMLNLSSSDVFYNWKSNFPIYTEQTDPRTAAIEAMRKSSSEGESTESGDKSIDMGVLKGRTYPKDTERPGFISPPTDPLRASMEKQERMKEDIRQLTALSLSSLKPKMQSAASKAFDNEGLEGGLSSIGFVLETAEREICRIWSKYEGSTEPYQITYPRKYTIKSDHEILKEAESKTTLITKVPSLTYQKEMSKDIAQTTIGYKVSPEVMSRIEKEIDDSKIVVVDPEIISKDTEAGLVGIEFASKARGYPPDEYEKAKQDHADKLARISQYQNLGGVKDARGANPQKVNDGSKNDEKTISQNQVTNAGKKVRGPGK